jgi:hypothetical protein
MFEGVGVHPRVEPGKHATVCFAQAVVIGAGDVRETFPERLCRLDEYDIVEQRQGLKRCVRYVSPHDASFAGWCSKVL